MLLTLSTTHRPATDLGYLLHKNPDRVHETALPFGTAVMFYPETHEARATFVLALDIDPVALVRGKTRSGGERGQTGPVGQYVSDRPYAASSFLSVAIAKTLRNALGGSSKERPGLAEMDIPLTATVLPLPVRGSEGLVERLFEPLGYRIVVEPIPLDEELSWMGRQIGPQIGPAIGPEMDREWRTSPYVKLELSATCRLSNLLTHLYVLIPVLDRQKHYFVDRGELQKLMDKGAGWLAGHPERELIATRYLRYKRSLAREVLERLAREDALDDGDLDDAIEPGVDPAAPSAPDTAPDAAPADGSMAADMPEPRKDAAEHALEQPIRLHEQRLDRVADVLKTANARRVVDLGCGSGKLLKRLMQERQFTEILGMDVSTVSLEHAVRRLRFDRLSERQRQRVRLLQGALTYRDRRIEGFDAAALVEVIEHLDVERLSAMERAVFEFARPALVIITTPNREYNARFEGMAPDQMRHADHRFEWTRQEFRCWAEPVAARFAYRVRFEGIGEADAALGHPSQMAVFERTQ